METNAHIAAVDSSPLSSPVVLTPERTYRFEEEKRGSTITVHAICNETGERAKTTLRMNAVSSSIAQVHACLIRELERK